jgi:hypothetical protein
MTLSLSIYCETQDNISPATSSEHQRKSGSSHSPDTIAPSLRGGEQALHNTRGGEGEKEVGERENGRRVEGKINTFRWISYNSDKENNGVVQRQL